MHQEINSNYTRDGHHRSSSKSGAIVMFFAGPKKKQCQQHGHSATNHTLNTNQHKRNIFLP